MNQEAEIKWLNSWGGEEAYTHIQARFNFPCRAKQLCQWATQKYEEQAADVLGLNGVLSVGMYVFEHVWAEILSSPFDQFSSTFRWVSSERCHHRLLVSPASCWLRRHGNMLSRCEKSPVAGITHGTSTHAMWRRKKKKHALITFSAACRAPVSRGGEVSRRENQTEVLKAPGCSCWPWSSTSRMPSSSWIEMTWPDYSVLKMVLHSFTWERLIGHMSQKCLWGYLSGNCEQWHWHWICTICDRDFTHWKFRS